MGCFFPLSFDHRSFFSFSFLRRFSSLLLLLLLTIRMRISRFEKRRANSFVKVRPIVNEFFFSGRKKERRRNEGGKGKRKSEKERAKKLERGSERERGDFFHFLVFPFRSLSPFFACPLPSFCTLPPIHLFLSSDPTMTTSEAKPRATSKGSEAREQRRAEERVGADVNDDDDGASTSTSTSTSDDEGGGGEGGDEDTTRGYHRLDDAPPASASDDDDEEERGEGNGNGTAAAEAAVPFEFSVLSLLAPPPAATTTTEATATTAAAPPRASPFRSIIDESVPTASGLLEARSEPRGMEKIDAKAVAAAFLSPPSSSREGGGGVEGKRQPPPSSSSSSNPTSNSNASPLLTAPPAVPEWARGLEGEALRVAAMERVQR